MRTQKSECRMQNEERNVAFVLHSAFCIHHSIRAAGGSETPGARFSRRGFNRGQAIATAPDHGATCPTRFAGGYTFLLGWLKCAAREREVAGRQDMVVCGERYD